MDYNGQFRYKFLMSKRIRMPAHFRKRYKERVSKGSAKALGFTRNAYLFGKGIDSLKDEKAIRRLSKRAEYGNTCKIYRGFVFWFNRDTAITVYPVSSVTKRMRSSTND